jgi:hypothetical protein
MVYTSFSLSKTWHVADWFKMPLDSDFDSDFDSDEDMPPWLFPLYNRLREGLLRQILRAWYIAVLEAPDDQ